MLKKIKEYINSKIKAFVDKKILEREKFISIENEKYLRQYIGNGLFQLDISEINFDGIKNLTIYKYDTGFIKSRINISEVANDILMVTAYYDLKPYNYVTYLTIKYYRDGEKSMIEVYNKNKNTNNKETLLLMDYMGDNIFTITGKFSFGDYKISSIISFLDKYINETMINIAIYNLYPERCKDIMEIKGVFNIYKD